jgi:hypothetical protein
MHKIIRQWELTYFTELLLDVFLVTTLLLSLKKRNQYPQLKYIPLYLGSFIFLAINGYAYRLSLYAKISRVYLIIDRFCNYSVTLIEFIAFSYFFYSIIQSAESRRKIVVLITLSLTYFLIVLIQIIHLDSITMMYPINNLYIVESVSLFLMCSFYFINLFKSPPISKLTTSPNFWTSAGLCFYLLATLPITIATNYFVAETIFYKSSYSLIYVSYTLLFLMIIKGYSCRNGKME